MKNIFILFLAFFTISLNSCRKYLDKKSDLGLNTPSSLSDFQALLDNDIIWTYNVPQVGDHACDDYSFTPAYYQSILNEIVKSTYVWADDIWKGQNADDWSSPYNAIYYSNVVLEGLEDFPVNTPADQEEKNRIMGHALFIRAHMHYALEETFGQPYRPSTAATDLGVPLRLNANLEDKIVRSSVQAVYDQIIADLTQAAQLLPPTTTAIIRPPKAAALGLLARVYLTKQDYVNAGVAATNCIQNAGSYSLIDFNDSRIRTTGTSAQNPFGGFTYYLSPVPEILYACRPVFYGFFRSGPTTQNQFGRNVIVDSNLYKSYDNNDLRKGIYYIKTPNTPLAATIYYLKTDYFGVNTFRNYGINLNEVYLIRAESHARAGNKDAALADLNALLIKRWRNSVPYPTVTAGDAEEALRKIIVERKKELIFRGLRWIDLRRLNQDPRFADTLYRYNINGQDYQLLPNDPKYTFPIPDNEIRMTGIQQNPR